jgi:hypothetical protein
MAVVCDVPPPPQLAWHPAPRARRRRALAARSALELVPLHATAVGAHGAAVGALVAVPGGRLLPSDVHGVSLLVHARRRKIRALRGGDRDKAVELGEAMI